MNLDESRVTLWFCIFFSSDPVVYDPYIEQWQDSHLSTNPFVQLALLIE